MIIGFVIWSIVAIIFLCIGISSRRSKNPVGFFTFAGAPKVDNVSQYNRAVSTIWIAAATVLELIGFPTLFLKQNSPLFILLIFAVVMLVLAMMIAYHCIVSRYKAN